MAEAEDDSQRYTLSEYDHDYFGAAGASPILGPTGEPMSAPQTPSVPGTPGSLLGNGLYNEDIDSVPPLDRLTLFDFLENLSLPQRLEGIQHSISTQTERLKRQQQKLRQTSMQARNRVFDEWRKRAPDPEERLRRYRRAMRTSVERLGSRWEKARTVTLSEKTSFVLGVLDIFISGYILGAWPEWFHIFYTIQVLYFYPVRWVKYHKIGYHYFLADLCYFVNLLLLLSIWVFPQSKRLLISTFCLAYGNNAVAIVMWRNSLVFHSLDKVTSLFIHVMPCVTLHCMVHLWPSDLVKERMPSIYAIKTSDPTSPEHYGLAAMAVWSTIPYSLWQISYAIMITIRRADRISAGRPTSFTWLRKSYGNTWLGQFVLARPEHLQQPTFMLIQYTYALLTMLPAPLWFYYRWASAGFLMGAFTWSVYNGAVYYIDIFGRRFQKELEQLKKDVAKWQASPEIIPKSPSMSDTTSGDHDHGHTRGSISGDFSLGDSAMESSTANRSAPNGDNMTALSTGAAVQGSSGNGNLTARK